MQRTHAYWNYLLNIGINYSINQRLSLNLEPTYKSIISTVYRNDNSQSAKPYTFGIKQASCLKCKCMNKLISAIFKRNKILYLVLLLIAHCSLLIAQTPSPLVQANFPSNGNSVNFTTFNLPVEVTFNPNNLNPKDTNTFNSNIRSFK